MAEIVVAVYDHYIQAEQALNELLSNGFSIEHVKLSPAQDNRAARQAALRHEDAEENGVSGTILGLFRSFFGAPEKYSHENIYLEAVRRGSCVLTVQTASGQQSAQATEIMQHYEPVDIDERAAQWQTRGWSRYDMSAPVFDDDQIRQERSGYGAGAADQQRLRGAGSSGGNRAAPHAGVRVFQRAADELAVGMQTGARPETIHDTMRRIDGDAAQANAGYAAPAAGGADSAPDDNDFRTHWQGIYGESGGSYDDYAPAYRHGYGMAGEPRYRNVGWSEAEPELRRDWEANHAGHPWERVKDAVRYGWDKLTRDT